MYKKIIKFFRKLLISLSYGLKNTEDTILKQKTTLSEENTIQQKMQMNDLGEALLKGEVTQEVEVLRDRTYLVSDKSKEYKVVVDTIGTTKAIRGKFNTNKPLTFEEDGFDVKLIMDNNATPSGVLEAFNSIGTYGIKNIYPAIFKYEYTPKFNLADYVRKIVLRCDENKNHRLDLYVPKYSDSFERLEKIFDTEIKKIKEGIMKPINVEFETVYFISDRAYGSEDLCEYKFKMRDFIGVNEFDGKYILSYNVDILEYGNKITDKYKNEKLRDAYDKKEKKNINLNMNQNVDYKHNCDSCGTPIKSNHDYRITKQSIGKGLCVDCLEKHLKNVKITI